LAIHAGGISFFWLNACWAYACCSILSPSPSSPPMGSAPALTDHAHPLDDGFPSYFCKTCNARSKAFDHHCPFTGGCIGLRNFRYFLVFALHAWLGMGYASYLSWWPFRDCVLTQITAPRIGWVAFPPPDESLCRSLGARSLLLLPALALHGALWSLVTLHTLLLANGLSVLQLSRIAKRRGWRVMLDLLRLRLRSEGGDKWALVWGRPSAQVALTSRLRLLALPSLPTPSGSDVSLGLCDADAH